MNKKRRRNLAHLASVTLVLGLSVPTFANAEIAIIGNKSIPLENITAQQAGKLWLAKIKRIDGSGKLKVSDATKGSPTYNEFYANVVHKSPKQLKIYWGKMMFSGKTFPPPKLYSDADILQWVSSTNNALGYVAASAVDDSVKVLLKK